MTVLTDILRSRGNGLILLVCLGVLANFNCSRTEAIDLTFAFGPDDSGAIASLIEDFNRQHKRDIHINWLEGARASNEFFRQIAQDIRAETPQMDIIAADVVWTAALASEGWVQDLTSRFFEEYPDQDFLQTSLDACGYQSRIWGVPWYADAGILFYRKDLLEKHGYTQAPKTWEELRDVSLTIMEQEGMTNGMVFQGANYEGGVVNACEFIWNAGGELLISDLSAGAGLGEDDQELTIITVNSEAAKAGLGEAVNLIESGVTPGEVAYFKEQESTDLFAQGEAIFMRNWPTAFPRLLGEDRLSPKQIGVAALPVSRADLPSSNCLGGWNLALNQRMDPAKLEAAWTFINFLTAPEQQWTLALEGGTLPSLSALYQDSDLLEESPILSAAYEALMSARKRPVTPSYLQIAPDLAWSFHEVLKGNLNPTEAVETMQGHMEGSLATTK